MIYSLNEDKLGKNNYYYIIIGGGTAGLICAKRIRERIPNKNILVIESGSRDREDEQANILNKVINLGRLYSGATEGRRRAIGGTSTIWGGAMLTFQSADLVNANWPIKLDELNCYEPEIDKIFGLDSLQTDTKIVSSNFIQRRCKWPSFSNRNVRNIQNDYLQSSESYDLLCDATVVEIEKHVDEWIIKVKSLAGYEAKLYCQKIIIAAGAIETTRLAMTIRSQNNNLNSLKSSSKSSALGRYFSDHISVCVAEIIPQDLTKFYKKYLFKFGKKGSMSNLRYELSENSVLRKETLPIFMHIGYRIDVENPFGFLREIYQAIQKRVLPSTRSIFGVLRGLPWLIRAAYWRFVHKSILWPTGSNIILNIVVEQGKKYQNHVGISGDKLDVLGQNKVMIDWNIDELDKQQVLLSAKLACDFLEVHESNMLMVNRFSDEKILDELQNSGEIFHPTSSTIMGNDVETSVVDRNLALHADKSVFLLSTSVFPSGGGANPTKMLLLLAFRLVDFLAQEQTN